MLTKLSALAVSIVVFLFVVVSIAHACSGLAPIEMSFQQSPMNTGADDKPPCSKEKEDICKSVRDSLLSVKPSILAPDDPQQTAAPLELAVKSPTRPVSVPVAPLPGVAFHPVFKLPLIVSYLVLRI